MATRIGKMRKRVTIYDRTDDEAGEFSVSTTRTNPRTVWARVDNITGTQQIDSRNAGTGVSHRITIRYRTDVTLRNQIEYNGKLYDIQTVQETNEDRRRFTVLECIERDVTGTLDDTLSPE